MKTEDVSPSELLKERIAVAVNRKDEAKAAVEVEWKRFKERLPADCGEALEIGFKLAFSAGLGAGFRLCDEQSRKLLEELARQDHVLVYLGAIHEVTKGLAEMCKAPKEGERRQ